jgi:hypothetical protein
MSYELEGGCACGAVRYTIKAAPLFVHCCHCLGCQRQTGSAFVINALIETEHVDVRGAVPVRSEMPTDSGRPHGVYRCPACGTAVWSEYGGLETLRFVRVGTLDEPRALAPSVHIYTRTKQPWVALPEGVPAFEGYYDASTLWPPEMLARRAALFAARPR